MVMVFSIVPAWNLNRESTWRACRGYQGPCIGGSASPSRRIIVSTVTEAGFSHRNQKTEANTARFTGQEESGRQACRRMQIELPPPTLDLSDEVALLPARQPHVRTEGMPTTYSPGRTNFGLLPEPEGRSVSFITTSLVNLSILGVILYVGMTARQVIQQHYEMTELIVPSDPPPEVKVKQPPPPAVRRLHEPPEVELQPRQIEMPKPKPVPKPVQMEAKVTVPKMDQAKPQIILAPQPKAALAAAMPAQNYEVKVSTAPVHLGQTFGVTPNPNATRPATVAAIGNPYGGMQGPAVAPHGIVGSTGFGNGTRSGSSDGVVGKWLRQAFRAMPDGQRELWQGGFGGNSAMTQLRPRQK